MFSKFKNDAFENQIENVSIEGTEIYLNFAKKSSKSLHASYSQLLFKTLDRKTEPKNDTNKR